MAAQGVTQGDGEPITAKRLTALIASVKKQRAKQGRQAGAPRTSRGRALVAPSEPIRLRTRLGSELTNAKRRPTTLALSLTEEEFREANLNRHADLFRKG